MSQQDLKSLENIAETQQATYGQLQEVKDGETRTSLAEKIVKYYFRILILIIVGVPIYNYLMYSIADKSALIISLKDAILTYSAVAGSTFGLVVAYYFQSKRNK